MNEPQPRYYDESHAEREMFRSVLRQFPAVLNSERAADAAALEQRNGTVAKRAELLALESELRETLNGVTWQTEIKEVESAQSRLAAVTYFLSVLPEPEKGGRPLHRILREAAEHVESLTKRRRKLAGEVAHLRRLLELPFQPQVKGNFSSSLSEIERTQQNAQAFSSAVDQHRRPLVEQLAALEKEDAEIVQLLDQHAEASQE